MAFGKWIISFAFVLSFCLSCQRATEGTSQLSISVQGNLSGQSGTDLRHVVINITGSDMSPVIYSWDRHGENGVEQQPPSEFNFNLNSGTRTVQVIAVYQASNGSGMDIYYGDSTKELRSSTENLSIPVFSIGQGSTVISGNISGRYLTSAGQGPTGKVDIRYQPPGNKPEMSIESSHIVNGWFNLMALTAVPLRYVVSDGSVLWDGPVSLDSSMFSSSSTKISRVSVPVVKRKEYQVGNYQWMDEDAQIFIYGWFGPASSSEIVCQPSVLGSFTRIVKYNTPGLVNGSDPSPGYFLSMTTASAPPTLAELTSTASASGFVVAAYGQTSSGACAGYTELTNKISLAQTQFDGNGNDGAAAFAPPFAKMGSQSSIFTVQASAGVFSISGKLLPDLYPTMIDGLSIYKRVINDGWSAKDSSFPCKTTALGASQFSLVSQISTASLASGVLSYTPVLASGEQAYSGTAVLVCPSKGGNLLEWGHVMKGNHFY